MNPWLSLTLNMEKIPVLIVGGGNVAYRKLQILHPKAKEIRLISPHIIKPLSDYLIENQIPLSQREYREEDLADIFFCVAATDSPALNHEIAIHCRNRKILCDSASQSPEANVQFPAVFQEADLSIAVSTGGKSPYFARKFRDILKKEYSGNWSNYLSIIADIRERYLRTIPSGEEKLFWDKVFHCLTEEGLSHEELVIRIEKEFLPPEPL